MKSAVVRKDLNVVKGMIEEADVVVGPLAEIRIAVFATVEVADFVVGICFA